jgi:hypothetical protein
LQMIFDRSVRVIVDNSRSRKCALFVRPGANKKRMLAIRRFLINYFL